MLARDRQRWVLRRSAPSFGVQAPWKACHCLGENKTYALIYILNVCVVLECQCRPQVGVYGQNSRQRSYAYDQQYDTVGRYGGNHRVSPQRNAARPAARRQHAEGRTQPHETFGAGNSPSGRAAFRKRACRSAGDPPAVADKNSRRSGERGVVDAHPRRSRCAGTFWSRQPKRAH